MMIGAGFGAANGVFVRKVKVPALIMTLIHGQCGEWGCHGDYAGAARYQHQRYAAVHQPDDLFLLSVL